MLQADAMIQLQKHRTAPFQFVSTLTLKLNIRVLSANTYTTTLLSTSKNTNKQFVLPLDYLIYWPQGWFFNYIKMFWFDFMIFINVSYEKVDFSLFTR